MWASCPVSASSRPIGLSVRHGPGPVLVGAWGDYPVVADPEPLPAAGAVDVLGREAQRPGVGVDGFLPLCGPALEGAGPVAEAPGDPEGHVGTIPKETSKCPLSSCHRTQSICGAASVKNVCGPLVARSVAEEESGNTGIPNATPYTRVYGKGMRIQKWRFTQQGSLCRVRQIARPL